MKKILTGFFIGICFMIFIGSGTPWNLVKTKFNLITYNSSVESGGTTIAEYDSSAIVLNSDKTSLTFFTSVGDSFQQKLISDTADTMFFRYADAYYFDAPIVFASTSWVISGTAPDLKFVDSSGVTSSIYQEVCTNFTYADTSQKNVKLLPAGAVIWSLSYQVKTIFNDSGTDLMKIGVTADNDYFIGNVSLGSTGWGAVSSSNVPEYQNSPIQVTVNYAGQNGDATTGSCDLYIFYSLN